MASNSNEIAVVVGGTLLDAFLGKLQYGWMSLALCPKCQQYSGFVRDLRGKCVPDTSGTLVFHYSAIQTWILSTEVP